MARSVVILGGAGRFGTLFSRLLKDEGYAVTGVDAVAAPAGSEGAFDHFLPCDVTGDESEVLRAAVGSDWLISCMPERPTLHAIDRYVPHLPENAVFADILSVKANVTRGMKEADGTCGLVSLHPMFAPSLEFNGQNVVFIPIRENRQTEKLSGVLERWGARVIKMTAEEHDHHTAAIQVASHFSILAFGLCLSSLGCKAEETMAISTPVYRTLLAVLARITGANPDIFWQIQKGHSGADSVHQSVVAAAEDLIEVISRQDEKEFLDRIRRMRDVLGESSPELAGLCGEIFRVTSSFQGERK